MQRDFIEEIEKEGKICHLKRKEKTTKEFLKRRLYESYHIICGHDPDFPAVRAINAVVVGRSGGGGSLS
jgi:hypothetical protein